MDKLIRSGEEWQVNLRSRQPTRVAELRPTYPLLSHTPLAGTDQHRFQGTRSTGMWEEEKSSGKRFGIIVHRLLSEITASSDIERAVQAQVFDGLFGKRKRKRSNVRSGPEMELPGMEATTKTAGPREQNKRFSYPMVAVNARIAWSSMQTASGSSISRPARNALLIVNNCPYLRPVETNGLCDRQGQPALPSGEQGC